jgi:hypothetical protein
MLNLEHWRDLNNHQFLGFLLFFAAPPAPAHSSEDASASSSAAVRMYGYCDVNERLGIVSAGGKA